MGYSTLLDSETDWDAARVTVTSLITSDRITAANGDPWMATNLARDRIYYLNLGISARSFRGAPDVLLLSVHDGDKGPFWHPAFEDSPLFENQRGVSVVGGEPGNDKPSIAVSQDAREDICLAWVCPMSACAPTSLNAVHFLRVDRTGTEFVATTITAEGRVGNPILATSPHEPNSVFVAYQVLVAEDPDRWVVRLSKSIDRGVTFPAFVNVDISPPNVAPDQSIVGARGAGLQRLLRNGVFMDYFATEEGWHYVVWESDGQVYFSRSAPTTTRRDALTWSPPDRLSVAPLGGRHPRDFQPAVAANGSRVAVVFYEQSWWNATTFAMAWLSDNRGDQWRFSTLSRDDTGAAVVFEPCLLQNRPGRSYYGDYIDVVSMALPGGRPDDRFFASWTDSRVPAGVTGGSCPISGFSNAVHHHTYGALFQ